MMHEEGSACCVQSITQEVTVIGNSAELTHARDHDLRKSLAQKTSASANSWRPLNMERNQRENVEQICEFDAGAYENEP